jgi:hypothetical protein
MANAIKTAAKRTIPAALAKQMTDFGAQDGKGENIRIEAINAFATAIRGGKSNAMPIDVNTENWQKDVEEYAILANNAYCAGQNKAAGYLAVSGSSANTYMTYFRTVGIVAVKSPDLVAGLLSATNDFCAGKAKKELGGRTKLQVYYRLACELRDTLFGKTTGKNKIAARDVKPSEVTAALAKKALDNAATRAKRAEPTTPAPVVETLDTLKASAMECASKLKDNAAVPANIRKALALIAAWK